MNDRESMAIDGTQGQSVSVAIAKSEQEDARRRQMLYRGVTLFLALALVAMFTAFASGQAPTYKRAKLDPRIEVDEMRNSIDAAAKSYAAARDLGGPMVVTKAKYYYSKYIAIRLSQGRMDSITAKLMKDAQARLVASTRSRAPGAQNIREWLYTSMRTIAIDNYAPVSRVAAITFLTRFDQGRTNGIPVPDSRVFGDLCDAYRSPNAPEAVQAAALHGLERVVRYTATNALNPAAKRNALMADMKKLLAEEAPEGRDPEVHGYMQRFAVDILSNLNQDGDLAKTLVSVSTKESATPMLALHSRRFSDV